MLKPFNTIAPGIIWILSQSALFFRINAESMLGFASGPFTVPVPPTDTTYATSPFITHKRREDQENIIKILLSFSYM
jgi:hypothetical protein